MLELYAVLLTGICTGILVYGPCRLVGIWLSGAICRLAGVMAEKRENGNENGGKSFIRLKQRRKERQKSKTIHAAGEKREAECKGRKRTDKRKTKTEKPGWL